MESVCDVKHFHSDSIQQHGYLLIGVLAIRLQRRHGTWKYLIFKQNTYFEQIHWKHIWHKFMEYFLRCKLRRNFSTNIFSSHFGAYSVSDFPNGIACGCCWGDKIAKMLKLFYSYLENLKKGHHKFQLSHSNVYTQL